MKLKLSKGFTELTTEEQEHLNGGGNPLYSLASMIFSMGNIVGSAGSIAYSTLVSPILGALAIFSKGFSNGLYAGHSPYGAHTSDEPETECDANGD